MATIHEIHNASGISIRSLNNLDKLGFLRVTKSDSPEASKMVINLRKSNPLTAGQLVMLYQEPALFAHLGKQEPKARFALDEVGDIEGEKAPIEIAGMLAYAASRDVDSIAACAAWLRGHMDRSPAYAEPMPYRYVAVRLLASLPPHLLKANLATTAPALLQIRKHPLLERYSYLDVDKKTFFQRPKLALDL